MSRFILSLLLFINLYALENLKPTYVYKAHGSVTDIIVADGKLYVSTDASGVDIFDLKTKKMLNTIKVPQIKDFMGDIIDAKIYNTDNYKNKVLLTVQATSGYRELYLFNGVKLEKLISEQDRIYISKALFLDENNILFCTLGNEMHLYNIKSKKTLWTIDVKSLDAEFNSTFADFVLDEKKQIAVVADESGDLKIIDIKQKRVTKVLNGQNLDKVFKVDIKNNKIITAWQDRRCVVYNIKSGSSYHLDTKFLIYGAALSPSGKLGAFSSDEQNNVVVFNTDTKEKLYKLTQNLMTLSKIIFISEDEIFVTTDSNKFNYYKLK
jgi:outer membrane protein assembly factor BamB